MAQPDDRTQEVRRRGDGRSRWLAAGTFVVGLVAGVLLLGLLGQDPPPAVPTPGAATASGSGAPPPAPDEETGRVEVNAACLRAINAAQDIAVAVEELGAAAAALDAAQLDAAIRRIQPLQARLQENTAACRSTGPELAEETAPPPAEGTAPPPDEGTVPSPTPAAPAPPPG